MGKPLGPQNVFEKPKAAHCFPFFLGEKLALSRFRLGPSIFLKNRTILLPTYEFHQKHPQRFNTSQPQPRSHVCAVACPLWRWELKKDLLHGHAWVKHDNIEINFSQ